MKTPSASASTSLWVRIVVYLLTRLTRNRLTRGLTAFIQPALDALEASAAATARAERNLVIVRAQYDGADEELDEVVNQVEGNLLLHVQKNRKAPLYQKVFPNGLTAVTAAPVPDEIAAVKLVEAAMARELVDVEFATRLLPELRAAREELERQVPLFQAAVDEVGRLWAAELAARHDLRRQYRIIFAELVKVFPDSMKKVNSFFRDPGSARRAAPEEPETTEPAAPTAPTDEHVG